MDLKKNEKTTADKIGAEGAVAISKSLKINTTLTKLNLRGDWNSTIDENVFIEWIMNR